MKNMNSNAILMLLIKYVPPESDMDRTETCKVEKGNWRKYPR